MDVASEEGVKPQVFQDNPCKEKSVVPPFRAFHEPDELNEASEEELTTLPRKAGKISAAAWSVAVFSGAERFAFYALQAPLREATEVPRPRALADPCLQKITSRIPRKTLVDQEP